MSRKELKPSDLLFHSFRHGHGAKRPQLNIFRYMDLEFGIQPDLYPAGEELQRYVKFLSGASRTANHHIPYTVGVEGKTRESIEGIRDFYRDEYRPTPQGELITIIYGLAHGILRQEIRILDQGNPWRNPNTGDTTGRTERIQQRMASGKGSFVYHYGRDGHHTGYDEFDAMYAAMWQHVETCKFLELIFFVTEHK